MERTKAPSVRKTKQKNAVKSALGENEYPLSPLEILTLAKREVPSLGLATVYRCLKELRSSGEVDVVEIPGEVQPKFEMSSSRHHHHFVCRRCHNLFPVNNCSSDLVKLIPQGFTLEKHELFLYGSCAMCLNNLKNNSSSSSVTLDKVKSL